MLLFRAWLRLAKSEYLISDGPLKSKSRELYASSVNVVYVRDGLWTGERNGKYLATVGHLCLDLLCLEDQLLILSNAALPKLKVT